MLLIEKFQDLLKSAFKILDNKTGKSDFKIKTVSHNLKITYKNEKVDSIQDLKYHSYYVLDGRIINYFAFFNIIDEILLTE